MLTLIQGSAQQFYLQQPKFGNNLDILHQMYDFKIDGISILWNKYISAIKRNQPLISAILWINLQRIMLYEKRFQKFVYRMIFFFYNTVKFTKFTNGEQISSGQKLETKVGEQKDESQEWLCLCVVSLQSCLTLSDPMDYSPLGSSVHVILQVRILGWVPFLQGIFPTQGRNTCLLCHLRKQLDLYHQHH